MRVVVDTNVFVSGLLGVFSYPARIIDLVYNGQVRCVYDDRIRSEYRDVLARAKFSRTISARERSDLLAYLSDSGWLILILQLLVHVQTCPPAVHKKNCHLFLVLFPQCQSGGKKKGEAGWLPLH